MTPRPVQHGVGSNWSLPRSGTIDRGTRCSGQERDLGDGLRTRSLKLASNRANRHTLKAAPAAAILVSESGATGERRKRRNGFRQSSADWGNRCGMRQDGN